MHARWYRTSLCSWTDGFDSASLSLPSLVVGGNLLGAGDPLQVVPVKVTDTSADRMVFESITERSTLQGSQGQVVCLTGSYRQADDLVFRGLLDKMRWGCARPQDLTAVNATWSTPLTGHVTKLRIRKVAVTEINRHNLLSITSEPYEFTARDVFLTADVRERKDAEASLRTCVDFSLTLKQSALVILTRNVEGIPPGTGGIVKDIISRELVVDGRTLRAESVFCEFSGRVVEVGRARFSAYNASGKEAAFCEQVPLLLGWAITVHRAQGLTLDIVEIDFLLDSWTTCGLVYTALSRGRSLSTMRVRGLRSHLIQASRCSLAYYAVVLRLRGSSPEEDGQPPRDE